MKKLTKALLAIMFILTLVSTRSSAVDVGELIPIRDMPNGAKFLDISGGSPIQWKKMGNNKYFSGAVDLYGASVTLHIWGNNYANSSGQYVNSTNDVINADYPGFSEELKTVLSKTPRGIKNVFYYTYAELNAAPFSSNSLRTTFDAKATWTDSWPTTSQTYSSSGQHRRYYYKRLNTSGTFTDIIMHDVYASKVNSTYGYDDLSYSRPLGITIDENVMVRYEGSNTYRLVHKTPKIGDRIRMYEVPNGSIVYDPEGVSPYGNLEWLKIADSHFAKNTATLWMKDNHTSYRGSNGSTTSTYIEFDDMDAATPYSTRDVKSFIDSTFYNGLSSQFKKIIVPVDLKTGATQAGSGQTNTNQKLFLLSATELGRTTGVSDNDGVVLDYFAGYSSYATARRNSGYRYWTRTPDPSYSTGSVFTIDHNGGHSSVYNANDRDTGLRVAVNINADTEVIYEGSGKYRLHIRKVGEFYKLSELRLGAVIRDPEGTAPHGDVKWQIMGHDFYNAGQTALMMESTHPSYKGTNGSSTVSYTVFHNSLVSAPYKTRDIYELINDTVYVGLSDKFKAIIRPVTIYTGASSGVVAQTNTLEKLFLPSAMELDAVATSSHTNVDTGSDGKPFKYYKFEVDKLRNCDYAYWTRTPSKSTTNTVHVVSENGVLETAETSQVTYGLRLVTNVDNDVFVQYEGNNEYKLIMPTVGQTYDLGEIPLGSIIYDPLGVAPHGNLKWKVVERDYYKADTSLIMMEKVHPDGAKQYHNIAVTAPYNSRDIFNYMSSDFHSNLSLNMRSSIVPVDIQVSKNSATSNTTLNDQAVFIPGASDLGYRWGLSVPGETLTKYHEYLYSNQRREVNGEIWTRSPVSSNSTNMYVMGTTGEIISNKAANTSTGMIFMANLRNDTRVRYDGSHIYRAQWNNIPDVTIDQANATEHGQYMDIVFTTSDADGSDTLTYSLKVGSVLDGNDYNSGLASASADLRGQGTVKFNTSVIPKTTLVGNYEDLVFNGKVYITITVTDGKDTSIAAKKEVVINTAALSGGDADASKFTVLNGVPFSMEVKDATLLGTATSIPAGLTGNISCTEIGGKYILQGTITGTASETFHPVSMTGGGALKLRLLNMPSLELLNVSFY